jgi:hypothetical protein
MVVLNVPQGVIFTAMFAAASTGTDWQDQGVASGVVSTGQQVGSAVGLAVLVAVANSSTVGHSGADLLAATSTGLRNAVLVAVAGMLLTLLVAVNFRRPPSAESAEPEPAGVPETVRD